MSQGQPRVTKSGRKNERTILPEIRQGFSRLCGLLSKTYSGFRKNSGNSLQVNDKSNNFEWSTVCKSAVTELKKKLQEAPALRYPNNRDPYTITTVVSLTDIGAIRSLKLGTEDSVIVYAVKTVEKGQRKNSATKRKFFAIVHLTQNLKYFYVVCSFQL